LSLAVWLYRPLFYRRNTTFLTSQYVPVSNKELLDYFSEILHESNIPWEISNAHLLRGGSKTIIEMLFPTFELSVNGDDILKLKGYLTNSLWKLIWKEN